LIEAHRGELDRALKRVLDSGWLLLGPETEAFETEFAAFCGVRNTVSCACGTDALELMLRALEIGPGDEVITAANAGFYSSTAILRCGAQPVYADVEANALCLSAESVADAITERTCAVIATHLYGQLADIAALEKVCAVRSVPLLEDCAQAHGASRDGRLAGSFGRMAAFSFYPTKNLGALGDAGAVVTSDDELAKRLRALRQYGWEQRYVSSQPGMNSRMDECQAAALRVLLPALPARNERRKAIREAVLEAGSGGSWRAPGSVGEDHVAHLCILQTEQREALGMALAEHEISTAIHYPMADWQQPALAGREDQPRLEVTEAACRTVLTVPCFPEMTDEETETLCRALRSVAGEFQKGVGV